MIIIIVIIMINLRITTHWHTGRILTYLWKNGQFFWLVNSRGGGGRNDIAHVLTHNNKFVSILEKKRKVNCAYSKQNRTEQDKMRRGRAEGQRRGEMGGGRERRRVYNDHQIKSERKEKKKWILKAQNHTSLGVQALTRDNISTTTKKVLQKQKRKEMVEMKCPRRTEGEKKEKKERIKIYVW